MPDIERIDSATTTFLGLQSGYARPFWEVGISVSGSAATTSALLGQSHGINDIVSMGTIDREKPVDISGLSRIIAGDMTITLDNQSGTYSPLATASIFTSGGGTALDYIHSKVNVWAGFYQVDGTALVMQRGSFLLTKIRIDSAKRLTYLSCQDAAKIPLESYVGVPGDSGTATVWSPPSGLNTKAIMTELLSAVGLSSTQYDIASGLDFPSYKVENKNVGGELAKIAQANDGFVYTDGSGTVNFKLTRPVFSAPTTDLDLEGSSTTTKIKYTIDAKNLINHVQVTYGNDLDEYRGDKDATVTKGRYQEIRNSVIDRGSIAVGLSSKLLTKYKVNKAFLELENVWLPSIEVDDDISFYDENTYSTGTTYNVYRIREDIVNHKTKIYAVDMSQDEITGDKKQKWGFVSESGATVNSGTVFTDSWHSGFAFASWGEENIVTNYSFTEWDILTGTSPKFWARDAGNADPSFYPSGHDGNGALQLSANGLGVDLIHQDMYYAVRLLTGLVVKFSAWVKTNETGVYLSLGDSAGNSVSTIHPHDNAWHELTGTRTVDGGTTSLQFRVYQALAQQGVEGATIVDEAQVFVHTEGFDLDGDADGTAESGVVVSGAGTTGIELPFLAY